MQENNWARLRDSRPVMRAVHATWPTYFPAFLCIRHQAAEVLCFPFPWPLFLETADCAYGVSFLLPASVGSKGALFNAQTKVRAASIPREGRGTGRDFQYVRRAPRRTFGSCPAAATPFRLLRSSYLMTGNHNFWATSQTP